MQADAQSGLSKAARIESTKQLQFAQAKQNRRNANFRAATQLMGQMGENRQEDLNKMLVAKVQNELIKFFLLVYFQDTEE